MRQYLDLLDHVMSNGSDRGDRTGTGTRSVFGYQMRFDLSEGFPVLTTKKLHLRSIIHELLWFLKGDTNIAYLKGNGVSIWDEGALVDEWRCRPVIACSSSMCRTASSPASSGDIFLGVPFFSDGKSVSSMTSRCNVTLH